MSENTDLSMFDIEIDDLPELQGFAPLSPGEHRMTISFTRKEINGKNNVEMEMVLVETISVDEGYTAQEPGFKATVLFSLEQDVGLGKLKAVLKPLKEALGISAAGALMEAAKGTEVIIRSKLRKDKNDPEKKYTDIVAVTMG